MTVATSPLRILDAHTHVWELARTPQPWIEPDAAPALARDFALDELRVAAVDANVAGVILVQSANDVDETEGLVAKALEDPFVSGVVGWTDLRDARAQDAIETAVTGPGRAVLRGYRHVFQRGEAADWLADGRVRTSLSVLGRLGLSFDLLLRAEELRLAAGTARRHPDVTFVLDHLAKPTVRDRATEPWRQDLVDLGREPNVYAKFSGLPAEADWGSWSADTLRPYFEAALEAFGADRLIFATDWPVCTVAGSYSTVLSTQLELCAQLTSEEQTHVAWSNAHAVYRLDRAVT